jgi:hypothetical protein
MRSTIITLAIAAILCTSLDAQMTSEAARRAALKSAATATFLDSSQPESARLAAVKDLGYPDPKTFVALLAIGADPEESDAIRWEALKARRFDEAWLELVLKITGDPDDGGAFLDSKLTEELNRRVAFTLPAELRQRIQAVWRRLLSDPRDLVRLSAFRVSAANHDPVAVNILDESLRSGKDIPIPLQDAIDLLDLNGSINFISTLRPYLSHKDPAVQGRAARALALDPQSRPTIVELAKNSQTAETVRLQSLRGLAREDSGFAAYALPLLENVQEDGDVRYSAMKVFAGRMNYGQVAARDQIRFAEAVEKLAVDGSIRSNAAEKIRAEAKKLLAYLIEAFAEVKKHYANR